MSAVSDAAVALKSALAAIPTLKVYTELGSVVDPPAAILGPPELAWEATCFGPTKATFQVFVVVAANDHAFTRLWDLVPTVGEAIDDVLDAVTKSAVPSTYPNSGIDMPCYVMTVEIGLP